ncbi:MAG: hypothetical protein ACO29O_05845, partial [Chitinophagaceae bacterium]
MKFHLRFVFLTAIVCKNLQLHAQGTRLLRQPTINTATVAFIYGGYVWVVNKNGGDAKRITSTAAVEQDPHFSPDGKSIAFSSNRSGIFAVYTVAAEGGVPSRLTWYPADAFARGWTPDGKNILYASSRESAPTGYARLWTVSTNGGPSTMLPAPFAYDGTISADQKNLVLDRVSRWDVEWRHYRGGQNTPLRIMDLKTLAEKEIPANSSMDKYPNWIGNDVYFLSDRDFIMNV